jgi:hypothetical protein
MLVNVQLLVVALLLPSDVRTKLVSPIQHFANPILAVVGTVGMVLVLLRVKNVQCCLVAKEQNLNDAVLGNVLLSMSLAHRLDAQVIFFSLQFPFLQTIDFD